MFWLTFMVKSMQVFQQRTDKLEVFAVPVACIFSQRSSVLKTVDISCLAFLHGRHIVDFSTASQAVMETRDSYERLPLNSF